MLWIPIVGGFVAFFTAWGIGANDCANSFATSVGAKVITLKQALVISAIFEFSGAFLMGSHVTDTVRKKIIDQSLFLDDPNVLMFGMLCSCIATGIWLTIATYFKYPVSTTHSTIGAICGFAIASKGINSINGMKILEIVISWFLSPLLTGIFALSFFIFIRNVALRRPQSVKALLILFPFLTFITMSINSFFIIYKGTPALGLKDTPLITGLIYSFSTGGGFAIITQIVVVPYLKKRINSVTPNNITHITNNTTNDNNHEMNVIDDISDINDSIPALYNNSVSRIENIKDIKTYLFELEKLEEDEKIQRLHENAEVFDYKTEKLCSLFQVSTACFSAFAHGANDVANAIAPFATIIAIYNTGTVNNKSEVPIWILAIGGGGMVVGLGTWDTK